MFGIPINSQFIPIEIYHFGKWNGKPIFNEKQSILQ